MNEWSRHRKRVIALIVLVTLVVVLGGVYLLFSYKKPTCSDGKMNGDETGVDCGGSCQLLCTSDSLPIITKGDPQILLVATSTGGNTLQAVIRAENPNVSGEIAHARYIFNLYSGTSTLAVKTIEGQTFVPRGGEFFIFEGPFEVLGDIPSRISFEWDKTSIEWKKNTTPLAEVAVTGQSLINTDTKPRLDAILQNNSSGRVNNIDIIALLSDENGNTIAASRTFVDQLEAGKSTPIVFTWPRPFEAAIVQVEVVPRIFPDRSYLK